MFHSVTITPRTQSPLLNGYMSDNIKIIFYDEMIHFDLHSFTDSFIQSVLPSTCTKQNKTLDNVVDSIILSQLSGYF